MCRFDGQCAIAKAVQSERERSDPLQDMEDGDDDYRENSPDRCSVEVQTEQCSMKADALPSPDAELNSHSSHHPEYLAFLFELVITAERVATMKDVMQDWRRHFVLFADWLHALPEFASLSVDDQILIAKSRFGPFYWWMCANWTNEACCDGVCYANGTYFPRSETLQCFPDVRGCSERMVVTLSEPLRELQLDETEKCLMLAVIVFSDEPLELSISGKEHVRSMGHRFVRMLHHHIRNREPGLSNSAIGLRIAKIMILLTATTNLVYMASDNFQLHDVLHIVDFGSWPDDFLKNSFKDSI
ncbi:unnamed protein product [Nippostrongylus brasiliensis]|uniref:Nuclear hormone receptor family member nhr-62 (inferred by orthology to a C. elegans protein) n=1 Tax=Nippostrongylus brasiliensis TaxID=27835 RepID=A0A0N4YR89_NIPBR|nr:unnamed protein product [Nippostrongylus brasiliensis]